VVQHVWPMADPLPTRVWSLAMDDPSALRPAAAPADVVVTHAEVPLGSLNRRLYAEIGRPHGWIDRATWPAERWQRHAEGVETWVVSVHGTTAGMCELMRHGRDWVEVYVFGVMAPFQGRGAGGALLTAVLRRGWELGARRLTVETCELDGPGALPNYRARGFALVGERIEPRRWPASPVARLRDGRTGEAAALEALQLRASLVWEEHREHLRAHPEVVTLPPGGLVRVASDRHHRPLGFSVVLPEAGAAWELDGLFVEPAVQRAGVGRVLINDVLARARTVGVTRLDVVAGPARGFYERAGFAVVGEAPTRFGPALALSRPV
jgi:GNAT superfamily N-acetyltransferase